jgi:heme-degrading monooxygenase HmoA
MEQTKETLIKKGQDYVTEINFFHTAEENQQRVAEVLIKAAEILCKQKGFISVNILSSTDGTRLCSYIQWQNSTQLENAKSAIVHLWNNDFKGLLENNSGFPRLYEIYYADDRSEQGVSVISKEYKGTVFINEITTIPGQKQYRLLELVIANNINDSLVTPGYRSANFHRSLDGHRAVNYSLWDTEDHLIEAISAMAGEDINLEETMELATPDFRFYNLIFSNHN